MSLKCIKIGEINKGIEGCEAYYLVSSTDSVNVELEEAKSFMYNKYASYLEPRQIGGKFVSVISTTKVNTQFDCIAVVYWRYDT